MPLNVFAAAIGAGISSVGFDADKEKERHETNYVSASVLMILFFIVMIGALLSFALIPYNSALMEQKDLEKKQQQYEPARVVHDQYLGMKQLLSKVRYGHVLTERSNDSILDFLSELEDKMPADVEFTEIPMTVRQALQQGVPLPFPVAEEESELYSGEKGRKELGFSYISLEEGMGRTYRAFKGVYGG